MKQKCLVASVALLMLAPVPAFAFVPFLFIPAAGAALVGAAAGAASSSSGIGIAGRSAAASESTGSIAPGPTVSRPVHKPKRAKKRHAQAPNR
jgi:hypothetical protein